MLLEAAIPTALWTPKPQHRARQHWGHLREACSVQRQKAAGSKSEKQFCATEFRAAGQEPTTCKLKQVPELWSTAASPHLSKVLPCSRAQTSVFGPKFIHAGG